MQTRRDEPTDRVEQLHLFAEELQVAPDTFASAQEPEEQATADVAAPQEIASEEQELPDDATDEGHSKLRAALSTRHVVQPYRKIKVKRRRRLTPVDALSVVSVEAAVGRAERLFETGRYAGVDAFTVTADPAFDDYAEPVFHARLGEVPRVEG